MLAVPITPRHVTMVFPPLALSTPHTIRDTLPSLVAGARVLLFNLEIIQWLRIASHIKR